MLHTIPCSTATSGEPRSYRRSSGTAAQPNPPSAAVCRWS
jgi:hypothetical protein